ncbi:uncharacterized protein G2W53_039725 [Senna tora]|uniref:ATP-dependent DNA helicase n=1 Tax=Senna tora TaxID=362788 RepID=A0A834SP25_9FABA|nr:uncharacterized protein G2W53_039725 [Senna tora]
MYQMTNSVDQSALDHRTFHTIPTTVQSCPTPLGTTFMPAIHYNYRDVARGNRKQRMDIIYKRRQAKCMSTIRVMSSSDPSNTFANPSCNTANRLKRMEIVSRKRSMSRDEAIYDQENTCIPVSGITQSIGTQHSYVVCNKPSSSKKPKKVGSEPLGRVLGRVALTTLYSKDDHRQSNIVTETIMSYIVNEDYWDIGLPIHECEFCGALLWFKERVNQARATKKPKFFLGCMQGKVSLPPPKEPPNLLAKLITKKDSRSAHFMKEIRNYNNILLPCEGEKPKFAQLYIYDTHNEMSNRVNNTSSSKEDGQYDASLVLQISQLLDSFNPLVMQYRTVKERLRYSNANDLRLKLIRKRNSDARTYNIPSASEVTALIVVDFDMSTGERDIIVENRYGLLQGIDELHPLYLPMQYPLLFPYGEDGYRVDTLYRDGSITEDRKRRHLTLRQNFAYKLQDRRHHFNMILKAGKLSQQFMVDAFTSVEGQRTCYVRFHQRRLRYENYVTLTEALARGNVQSTSIGKRIILRSSFTGGERYSRENFQDAMTICTATGFPDLFITFTCNPRWPELDKIFKELDCKPEDRPDLVSRIFKIKLNKLIRDITKDMLFGNCKAGLPHAHILLWLSPEDKFTSASQIDLVIFAEIPNRDAHPELCEIVKNFMIHGPCGSSRKSSPCMHNGKCSKHFPKKFNDRTTFDEDGYCKYRRRDTDNVVVKNGIELDNQFVVPYNPTLLLRYQAHINVEFCNQSRSIKYLFKYVSKGHDRVTATIYDGSNTDGTENKDEIKQYYDCRYISPCEAVWRIFGFEINFREPLVDRLSFHLPNEQSVIFEDDDNIDDVVANVTMKQSKFIAWFEANKRYPFARDLTYGQFPTKFVFKLDSREWSVKKVGYAIGCLYYVPPGLGELHYLCLLLTFVKGATSFEDIRTVNGVLHPTFKDACYAMELLDDDKEYVDGITEASNWSSGVYLRKLFSTLLVHNTISRPEYVWEKTWVYLSDDIVLKERHRTRNPDLQMGDERIKEIALYGVFFVNGFGGSGKTFVWNTLTSGLRSRGDIVLAVASSGIASQLIPILKIGNGDIGEEINDEENEITIPNDILISKFQDPVQAIVDNTYPLFREKYEQHDYIRDWAILAPTLDDVASINNYMLSLLPGEEFTYLSSENICVQGKDSQLGDVYTTGFMNTISGSGLPYHQLKLKVGAPIMLLRNIDKSVGLCNGTRLTVKRLCTHVIEASILSGKHAGERFIIARMVITPSDSRLPFKFQRRQFPVVLSFAMTINKSQGQTLSNVDFRMEI